MSHHRSKKHYVLCIRNSGYDASLVVRKIYEKLPDADAGERKLIRVIDESGEDYLYPVDMFMQVELPESVEKAIISSR
ncbi:MAG: hypothetical protein MUP70_07565 [Candidatus Aminicenantes bacterium]|nr:hypothetical protein [Candidatus Aminicenantes bacterium]